jgi:RNase adapter protein RapZ
MRAIVVSGISGSGKTTFLKALEDIGYFCVDNFPLILLQRFLEVFELTGGKIAKCAFVVDMRGREFFEQGSDILKSVKEKYDLEIIFLDSADEMLLRRFKETRRSHPLYASTMADALQKERRQVEWIKRIADQIIDTSQYTPHDLRNLVTRRFGEAGKKMRINLLSFGYVYGIPLDADLVMDVRFLPNPYFIEGLKEKSGCDEDVAEYVRQNEVFKTFFPMLVDFLTYLIPLFEKEGKRYLTICVGCTGGRHRSVSIVNQLERHLTALEHGISVMHRDIDKEG